MKIYLVEYRETFNFDCCVDNKFAFQDKNVALAEFERIRQIAKAEYEKDYDTIEENDTSLEMYNEGTFCEDNIMLYLYELELL